MEVMQQASIKAQGIVAMRECVKARQAAADERQDQDSIIICNLLQDRLNELLMATDNLITVRPREADEASYIHFTLAFVAGILDMASWSEQISSGDYHGLYIPQAVEQLRSDLRNLLEGAA